jgi:hypothetical protein
MNSIAQQAVPNGIGQSEFLRPQFTNASSFVVIQGTSVGVSTIR